MRISERLKLICEHKNWKIKDFAELTGLPYRTMQGYIGGEREPNAEGMAAIAKAGINLNWLVSGEGEMFVKYSIITPLTSQEELLLTKFRIMDTIGKQISLDIMKAIYQTLTNEVNLRKLNLNRE